MKPVYQTQPGPNGNCFAACLATIVEVDLKDVPEFTSWQEVREWLSGRGYQLVFGCNRGYAIASKRLPDQTIHAAVYRDGSLVHDPGGRTYSRPEYPVLLWMQVKKVGA